MADVNFKYVQAMHESLLQKQQNITEGNQQEFVNEVRTYIEQAKKAGSVIPATRERDQVRANLRYWANYIYSIEKTFPDTELAPSTVSEKRPVGNIIAFLLFIILILFGTVQAFRSTFDQLPPATEPPTSVETETPFPPATEPPITTSTEAITTSIAGGSYVTLTSPESGSVLPKVIFRGSYANLDDGAVIYVLLIRGNDLLYPLQDSFTVPEDSTSGEWSIRDGTGGVELYRTTEELQQAENVIAVPAACFDALCRDTLTGAVKDGLSIKELPSPLSFTLYRDSSKALFRNAYQHVQGERIIYSYFDGTSHDLYTASLDGKEKVQITFTPDIDEMFPSSSPDGQNIVYVKRFHTGTGKGNFSYVVAIWDGEKETEIGGRTPNLLESTQWSSNNSDLISFTVGDTTKTPTSYKLFVYNLSTTEEMDVSAEFVRRGNYRYASWLPDRNALIFNVGTRDTGSSGFALVDLDTLAPPVIFFDRPEEEIEPSISLMDGKYLMTYIVNIDPSNLHDIYMVLLDPAGSLPHDVRPFQLVESTGEYIETPVLYPQENALYYTKYGSIYRAEYQIDEDGTISIKITPNVRSSGVVIIQAATTGEKVEQIYFDVHDMDMFFPLR